MEHLPKVVSHLKALIQAMVEAHLLLVIIAQAMVIAMEALLVIPHPQVVVHLPKVTVSLKQSHKSTTQTVDTLIKIFRHPQNKLKYKYPVFFYTFLYIKYDVMRYMPVSYICIRYFFSSDKKKTKEKLKKC